MARINAPIMCNIPLTKAFRTDVFHRLYYDMARSRVIVIPQYPLAVVHGKTIHPPPPIVPYRFGTFMHQFCPTNHPRMLVCHGNLFISSRRYTASNARATINPPTINPSTIAKFLSQHLADLSNVLIV
jgi:hypothetical protein